MRRLRLSGILVLTIVVVPAALAFLFAREFSGIGHWLRERRRRIFRKREPLADAEFAARLGLSESEAPYWLATRRVLARLGKVSPEAIRPEDPTALLGRLAVFGFDLALLIDPLARALGVRATKTFRLKITVRRRRISRLRHPQADQLERHELFADFAEAVATALLGPRPRERLDEPARIGAE